MAGMLMIQWLTAASPYFAIHIQRGGFSSGKPAAPAAARELYWLFLGCWQHVARCFTNDQQLCVFLASRTSMVWSLSNTTRISAWTAACAFRSAHNSLTQVQPADAMLHQVPKSLLVL
jgi:hypothetical protein